MKKTDYTISTLNEFNLSIIDSIIFESDEYETIVISKLKKEHGIFLAGGDNSKGIITRDWNKIKNKKIVEKYKKIYDELLYNTYLVIYYNAGKVYLLEYSNEKKFLSIKNSNFVEKFCSNNNLQYHTFIETTLLELLKTNIKNTSSIFIQSKTDLDNCQTMNIKDFSLPYIKNIRSDIYIGLDKIYELFGEDNIKHLLLITDDNTENIQFIANVIYQSLQVSSYNKYERELLLSFIVKELIWYNEQLNIKPEIITDNQ